MQVPSFDDDRQLADWFESTEVNVADLELADDICISPNLILRVEWSDGSLGEISDSEGLYERRTHGATTTLLVA